MKLKTIEIEGKTYAEVSDGKPLFLDGDKEIAFDAVGTVATISRLNGEAKGHREGKEAAEAKLKAFEGIADPAAAIQALATVKNLDDKKLIDAGEVEKVKAETAKGYELKLSEADTRYKALEGQLYGEKIGGSFARSKIIADKVAIPADMVEARFGKNFKIEDGKVVAYDASGNKLYSKAKPGEAADFEEALDMLIDAYPYKDTILKGMTGAGGGAGQGTGGTNAGKTMKQSEFDALSPQERAARMTSGYTIVA